MNRELNPFDYDAIGIGALNIDRLLRVRRNEGPNTEMVAFEQSLDAGGSAANTIYAMANLGLRTAFVGATGSDSGGTILRASFEKVNVDAGLVSVKHGMSSGEAQCIVDQHSQRQITLWPGANDLLCHGDLTPLLSGQVRARIIHMSSFVGDRQLSLQSEIAKSMSLGTRISLAPGALYARRGLSDVSELLEHCNILFLNADELSELMGPEPDEYVASARRFLEKFEACDTVVVTLGSGESTGRGRKRRAVPGRRTIDEAIGDLDGANRTNERSSCAVIERKQAFILKYDDFSRAVDTTGAGDAFTSGFLYGVLQRASLHQCAVYGHLSAQFCVTGLGARGHLPSRAQLQGARKETRARIVRL